MSKEQEKMMTDLTRLLKEKNPQSKEELQAFIQQIMGGGMPDAAAALDPKAQAQDLVFEAYDSSQLKAKKLIKEALALDPDCIEAYEYLATHAKTEAAGLKLFQEGVAIGRRLFGGAFLAENKGHFWGLHDTRPFMRCLAACADILYGNAKVLEAVAIFEEMIELNPNDNQGVRYRLMSCLLTLDAYEKYQKYTTLYDDDGMAFMAYNNALFAFKTLGNTAESNKVLAEALENNPFVVKKLMSKRPVGQLPSHYGIGDENEATYYAFLAKSVWQNTNGALVWLAEQSAK